MPTRSRSSSPSFSTPTPPPWTSTPSLHDALPISQFEIARVACEASGRSSRAAWSITYQGACRRQQGRHDLALRSEEHTSALQSPCNLVCRLLLEKINNMAVVTPVPAPLWLLFVIV